MKNTLGNRPFLRSLIIMPFLSSGLLSVYKIAITVHWSNPVAFMFTFVGMLLQFGIIGIVFVPDGSLSSGPLSTSLPSSATPSSAVPPSSYTASMADALNGVRQQTNN